MARRAVHWITGRHIYKPQWTTTNGKTSSTLNHRTSYLLPGTWSVQFFFHRHRKLTTKINHITALFKGDETLSTGTNIQWRHHYFSASSFSPRSISKQKNSYPLSPSPIITWTELPYRVKMWNDLHCILLPKRHPHTHRAFFSGFLFQKHLLHADLYYLGFV